MRHLVNTPLGRTAKDQDDLLRIAMNSSKMRTEVVEHPMSEIGFSQYGESGLERMDDLSFARAVTMLFKSRPSAHLWNIVPSIPYEEIPLLDQSPGLFKMTFAEKAQYLADEFLRRPNMVGFKLELHDVDRRTDKSGGTTPSVSITLYEASENFDDPAIPITITTKYRANF